MVMWPHDEIAANRVLGCEVILNRCLPHGRAVFRDGRVYVRSTDDLWIAIELQAMRNLLRHHLDATVHRTERKLFGAPR